MTNLEITRSFKIKKRNLLLLIMKIHTLNQFHDFHQYKNKREVLESKLEKCLSMSQCFWSNNEFKICLKVFFSQWETCQFSLSMSKVGKRSSMLLKYKYGVQVNKKKQQQTTKQKWKQNQNTTKKKPKPWITLRIIIFTEWELPSLLLSYIRTGRHNYISYINATCDYTPGTTQKLIQNATVEPKVTKARYAIRRSSSMWDTRDSQQLCPLTKCSQGFLFFYV